MVLIFTVLAGLVTQECLILFSHCEGFGFYILYLPKYKMRGHLVIAHKGKHVSCSGK
jgi:hypothetical protein